VRKLRVLVANRPRLMRELLLQTLSDQPDLEIVGEVPNEAEITELVDKTRPDCVIVGLDKHETRPNLCGFLLGRYPQMKVLAVAPELGVSRFYWAVVDIHSREVETSEDGLLSALRSLPGPLDTSIEVGSMSTVVNGNS
jgi:DNA-binding NarL/FixJ family response regulator